MTAYDILYRILLLLTGTRMPRIYNVLPSYSPVYSVVQILSVLISRIPFNVIGVIFALLVLVVFALLAVFNKRVRILAILAGISNFFAVLLAPWWARMHHTIPIRKVVLFCVSLITEEYINSINLTEIIAFCVRAINSSIVIALTLVAFILSTMCLLKCLKGKGKVIVIFAIIINVFRFIVLRPYSRIIAFLYNLIYVIVSCFYLAPMGNTPTELSIASSVVSSISFIGQMIYMAIYLFIVLLPILLVAVISIISFIKSKKQLKAEAVENSTEEKTSDANKEENKEENIKAEVSLNKKEENAPQNERVVE